MWELRLGADADAADEVGQHQRGRQRGGTAVEAEEGEEARRSPFLPAGRQRDARDRCPTSEACRIAAPAGPACASLLNHRNHHHRLGKEVQRTGLVPSCRLSDREPSS